MRLQCDKCDFKVSDPETSTAIDKMTVHYASHKGAKPKGTKSKKE